MALFSFFRTAKNQTFRYEPRYYDPIKEDLNKRKKKIQADLVTERKSNELPDYARNISGAFGRKTRSASYANTTLLQIIIMVMLTLTIIGWLQFGNQVFYTYFIFMPVYLFFRFKRNQR